MDDQLTPDQLAAHEFLSELRTRISTQPLPYQHGAEKRALESLWEVFSQARAAMKKYPGCSEFAATTTRMLNIDLRPVTAKWHRALEDGRLASQDGADEFRGDLAVAQVRLRDFCEQLHGMAYGSSARDALTPSALTEAELTACMKPISFGINTTHPNGDGDVSGKTSDEFSGKVPGEIGTSEAAEVMKRRQNHHIEPNREEDAVGLGLSGGGIRSATFCLGVVQVLAERKLLKYVDFLSTVSGGGYTGSFLTALLGSGKADASVANPHGPDPPEIRNLRLHAKFLTAIDLKDAWSMVTSTVAGMILNWSAPLFVIVAAGLLDAVFELSPESCQWPALSAAALTGLAFPLYCGLLRGGTGTRRWGGRLLSGLAGLTTLLGAIWLLLLGSDRFSVWLKAGFPLWLKAGVPASGVVAGFVLASPAILRFIPILRSRAARTLALKGLLVAAGLIIPAGAITLFWTTRYLGTLDRSPNAFVLNPLRYMNGQLLLFWFLTLLACIAFILLDINLTAPHRLYRDRLAAAFLQTSDIPLGKVNPKDLAPYQLINVAVNLPSSKSPALRDRRCDFFFFSKLWCGSPATGYWPTERWRIRGSQPGLATAMAISGAAASSHMGLSSMPNLTALLTFLNVRLGFWIRKPADTESASENATDSERGSNAKGPTDTNAALKTWLSAPGLSCLLREMTGTWMSEKQRWFNLSDGGHIENMGVYELLRRRCKFIVCVDGEADPGFDYGGLRTLVRHAQIDFGIRIEPHLGDLDPDSETLLSRSHWSFCRIHYPTNPSSPEEPIGLLLYMKLSMTGNEPELIRRYRKVHPDFPHQTTLDQFFDEEQFEVYRQLGVHVAESLFSPALMNGKASPETVHEWFRRLASNLLVPQGT